MNEFGKRRSEIINFLRELTDREKLVALTYLANDGSISARIPGLATTIMDMHRAHHRSEVLKSVGAKSSKLDLELLARRKGCRLERAPGSRDLLRIVPTADSRAQGTGVRRSADDLLTLAQALAKLRALPDCPRSI